MHEENKNKLIPSDEPPPTLDLKRDYSYGRVDPAEGAETHLRDYWRIVRRRLWVPVSIVCVTVTLTTIYMLRLPSIYEGVTTLQIDQENPNVVNIKDQLQINTGADAQYINTQLRNLQNPKVAYFVAKKLDLDHNPQFGVKAMRPAGGNADTLQVDEVGEGDEEADIRNHGPIIGALLGDVDIRPVRDTRLVQIRYRHEDRELARKVADTWADAFILNHVRSRVDGARKSSGLLEERIGEYKLNLRQAEERLQNYLRENEVLDFNQRENTVFTRMAEINRLLLQAENDRKGLELSFQLSHELDDLGTLPEIQRDPIVQALTQRITDLRQQESRLSIEFTPEWPEVKQIKEQLTRLDVELRASHQRILRVIENQYGTAQRREATLREALEEARSATMVQNDRAIQAKLLQAEVDTNRDMLKSLLESQKGIQVSVFDGRSNMRVTEYSPIPGEPVAPKRLQTILLSFFLATVGGVGLVLFLDYINNKIDSVEDIDRYLRLPALGVIPVFPAGKNRKMLGAGAGEGKELAPAGAVGQGGAVILTETEATSSIAECYRQLRTALLLSSAGHAPRTLLFTSSQPAEGKTTTCVNVAISLAQTGAAVLVVDADLRRPRVHKIFGLKNNAGLCHYLVGDCDLSSLIQLALPNLYVLPVGPLPPNPAELLGSAKMRQMIDALAENFDYVVIDSPPVSSFADSMILSSMVEGVIIVVKGGVTQREMAQRTKAHLQTVGAKILGVVINHVKLQPHDYYYYSTYYSRYYYGSGGEASEGQAGREREAVREG